MRWRGNPRQDFQQRRFSRAVVPDNPENLALRHIECHVPYSPQQIFANSVLASANGIEIDIPNRTINVALSDDVLDQRRAAMVARGVQAWMPTKDRPRKVSAALRAYAALATSADRGAVRDVSQVER